LKQPDNESICKQRRFAHVEELARRGLIEWAAVDPGLTNFSLYDYDLESRGSHDCKNRHHHG